MLVLRVDGWGEISLLQKLTREGFFVTLRKMEKVKECWPKIKSVLGKITRGMRRFWRGLAMGIGSLVLFFVIFSFLGGVGLPSASGLGKAGVTEEYVTGEGEDKIALIELSGLVSEEAGSVGPFSSGAVITPKKVRELLQKAGKDEGVRGVILSINSPGGSAVASNWIWEEIANFGKPAVALLGDTAASGGYFIASACDKIVADEATLTGSIGVIAEVFNLAGLYEKLGVEVEVFKKGEFKDILSSSRERTEEEKGMLDELLSDAYDLFLRRVGEGRGLEVDKVKELAEGRIYSGKKALEVGLVDEIGSLDKAVEVVKDLAGIEEAKVFEYSKVGLWESLFGGMGMGVLGRIFPKTNGAYPRVLYLLEI